MRRAAQIDWDSGDLVVYNRLLTEGPHAGMRVQVSVMLFNHRLALVYPEEFGNAERGFCMPTNFDAVRSAETWDGTGDPDRPWIKEVGTQRIGPANPHYKFSHARTYQTYQT